MCALETTDGASSLFDVRFPVPRVQEHNGSRDKENKTESDTSVVAGEGVTQPDTAAAAAADGSGDVGAGGGGATEEGLARVGGAPVLEEGGVVALVLGNEVTGVDERVLGLCDLVVEVGGHHKLVRVGGGLGARSRARGIHACRRTGCVSLLLAI